MPISRLFSRRDSKRTDTTTPSSRSLSSNFRSSTKPTTKPPYLDDPNPSGVAVAFPGDSIGPMQARNPSSTATPPTRRPDPSQVESLPRLSREAPPAYDNIVAQTPDDPYAFLSNFDTVFLIDDSGSMVGKSWRETAEALAAIAPICTARDKDGVDLYFLNNRTPYTNLTTAQAIQDVFEKNRPFGMTPTGTRLRHILKPYLDEVDLAMKQGVETKPLNVIVITDGVASDDVEAVILEAAKKLEKIEAPGWQVGVQFFQVGQEKGAAEALKELDDDLVAAGCPRDIVDTVPWNKGGGGEGLSADGVLKVVLGSVNRKLDRKRVSGDGPNRT